MILFNAALVAGYWERLLVLPLEQRRVAGREPPSERRSEGQPGYLGESLLHLHPHRAPITATQPTDILLTDIRATLSRAMDIQATREAPPTPLPPAMDTQAPRGTPPTRVPQVMDCQATRDTPLTPVLRAMETQGTQDSPLTPPLRAIDTQATRDTLPTPVPLMDTRAARHTLPIPVLVMEIRWLVIPAIALRRTGRLEPSTVSSLLTHRRRIFFTPYHYW